MKNKIKKITFFTIIFSIIMMIGIIILMVVNINKIYSEYRSQIFAAKDDDSQESIIEDYEEASSEIGKTVEEAKETIESEKLENTEKPQTKTTNEKSKTPEKKENKVESKKEEVVEEKIIPDPTFIYPVTGPIMKQYSNENLVYSETLKEWTTHFGIDIEGEISTVVKASSDGVVKAIKNDPRYGITVIISHANNYETRYSNLLTAEFIKEGENIKQGQTIGTIGNTATFEIADKPHLHFELLKNSEYLDPEQVLK